jgi:hypothetical protein
MLRIALGSNERKSRGKIGKLRKKKQKTNKQKTNKQKKCQKTLHAKKAHFTSYVDIYNQLKQ